MPKPTHYWPYLSAALGGVLLSLCYPPHDHSGLVWVFLIPLLAALWLPPAEPRFPRLRGALLGYTFGLAFFGLNFAWFRIVHPAAISIVFYLALYPAAFGAVAATLGRPRDEQLCPRHQGQDTGKWPGTLAVAWISIRCAALNAATWTGLEWLRGTLFTGFGWNGLGVAFHDDLLVLAQAADLIGVTGLSFMIVFTGTVFATTLRRLQLEIRYGAMRPHLDFAAAVLLIIAFFFYGIARTTAQPAAEPLVIDSLLVQANIPQEEKWDRAFVEEIYSIYERLTLPIVSTSEVDLVIWPEAALPLEYYHNYRFHRRYFNRLLAESDFSLVFGSNENALGEGYFNSIMSMRGNVDSMQSYRKIHLVPFGEYVPFRGKVKLLNFLEELISGDFDRGTSTEPMAMAKPEAYSIIPTVCFEDTIGRLTRKFVRPGPGLIVNCTNDGWFGESPCALQHMANAKFRCIELRRPMARAANTGVTCIIDETGSLDDRRQAGYDPRLISDGSPDANTFVEGFMATKIALDRDPPITFYARFGDLFSILCGGSALASLVGSQLRRRGLRGRVD